MMGYAAFSAILAVAALSATPADARAVFRGSAVLSDLSPGCPADSWPVGTLWSARYHLARLDGNPNFSSISLFKEFDHALNFQTGGNDFKTSIFGPITITSVFNSGFQYAGSAKVSRTPAAVGSTTAAVTLTAAIRNFDELGDGCTVTLTVQLYRRD